ncbi:hypothetical protein LTR70_007344 [Exophiala xenobiotica]|uniref:Ubiquitin-like domain-containing protein n=1 Tax=Lithohypha guttulata TaxID=1690604 RepID=A0ABR0K4M6_9EURO|nr:hypothetical protein LTR24_006927 [Lithohypha guttulata]KAK5313976.1 hypothetical protein LTR70_007344 [Exophiala xenobiotica]
MGCGSSREARPNTHDALPPARQASRSRDIAGTTSQTAINAPATSRYPANAHGPSTSNFSTPRTSTTGRPIQRSESLAEHYNVPLAAPKPWKSTDRTWTRSQLRREREEFFETQVTGQQEIWGALKEVCELLRHGHLADAQGIIHAAAITLPTGHLEQGAYDERGVLYRLPETVVSDPVNVVDDDQETVVGHDALSKNIEAGGLAVPTQPSTNSHTEEKFDKGKDAVERDAMKVRCRLSDRGGPDTIVLVGQKQPVSVLVRRLRSEATIASSSRVKIVYFGRILDESKTLEDQGWQQGHVVQVLVSNFAP